MPHEREISWLWLVLRLTCGLVALAAGLDKFLFVFGWWPQYMSPVLARLLPVTPTTFIAIAGVAEISIAITIFSPRMKTGAYVLAGWLMLTAVNLMATGRYADVAVRDLAIAAGAFVFARLTALGYRMEFAEGFPELRGAFYQLGGAFYGLLRPAGSTAPAGRLLAPLVPWSQVAKDFSDGAGNKVNRAEQPHTAEKLNS